MPDTFASEHMPHDDDHDLRYMSVNSYNDNNLTNSYGSYR